MNTTTKDYKVDLSLSCKHTLEDIHMNNNIEIRDIANDYYAIAYTIHRISGKPQSFRTILRFTTIEEKNILLKYFVEEAKRMAMDPQYEEFDVMPIETNTELRKITRREKL